MAKIEVEYELGGTQGYKEYRKYQSGLLAWHYNNRFEKWQRDGYRIEFDHIIRNVLDKLPIRSGLLVDTILSHLAAQSKRISKWIYQLRINTAYPNARPRVIIGHVQHPPPTYGWGTKTNAEPEHPAVKPRVNIIRQTKKSTLYELYDPNAQGDAYMHLVDIVMEALTNAFNRLKMNYMKVIVKTETVI